jgi:hypothetical protein
MKRIMDLSHVENAKITVSVIALYSVIGLISYFMWS